MTKQILAISFCILFQSFALFGQKEDPVLFTVEDNPVRVSEFNYIYTKTNSGNADYSRKSLEEYLELYIKFKLKVQQAKDMKLDTIPALQRELEGYRRQLANSYLIDREVTDKLVSEAYERMKWDVQISHILIKVSPTASPRDTLRAFQTITDIKRRLDKGEKFEDLALEASEDENSKNNGGLIGYATALFPNGFYPLETAAYNLEVGEVSSPVRTRLGYHLVKLNDKRPARGEIEAAHILIRKSQDRPDEVEKKKIDSLYNALQQGANFEDLAREFSEDKLSARKGGNIGFFGINKYEKVFEDAAFGLQEDGAYSKPVETKVGWHIIKRISKRDIQPFEEVRRTIQAKIQRDSRYEEAKEAMINRIKEEANFTEKQAVLQAFLDSINREFLRPNWKKPAIDENKVLFTLEKSTEYTVGDFAEYCKRASRIRFRSGGRANPREVAQTVYDKYVDENCMKYEESQLEKKYPEFKALMREYEEGILLFEATKILVWDKASQDTTGLKAYFERIKNRYRWGDRAKVTEFTLAPELKEEADQIHKMLKKNPVEKVLEKYNQEDKELITTEQNIYEKGKYESLKGVPWEVGAISEPEINNRSKKVNFLKIDKLLPPSGKTLQEARGYAVADYQDHLEREWVKELREKYNVEVNQDVFDSLIKK